MEITAPHSPRTGEVRATAARTVGELLREWRTHRGLTQLSLSLETGVSARHLSYLETGRAQPSRQMLERLATSLEIPLRERNQLLIAAGYAPTYRERSLDNPDLATVRQALNQILDGHEPYPALVADRWWNLVFANDAAMLLLEGADPALLEPPVNIIRLALHPKGFADRLANLEVVRASLLGRLRRSARATADTRLSALYDEVCAYPPGSEPEPMEPGPHEVALPLRLRHDDRELAFFTTVSTFGTAVDVTLSELAIELLYPADPETADYLNSRR